VLVLGERQHLLLGQPAEGDTVFEVNHGAFSEFRCDFAPSEAPCGPR
jgi:hypothetical protein